MKGSSTSKRARFPTPAFYRGDGRARVSVENCFKMWITSEGRVIHLPGFHREYIAAHAPELGVTITREGDGMRLDAIEAGLFRGNFEFGNGRLTFEGQAQYFSPTIRGAILRLVSKNHNFIGQLSLNLLDAHNKRYESRTVILSELDTRRERNGAASELLALK